MPDAVPQTPPSPAAPIPKPVAGAGAPPGQPPFGASPATPPTPNAGFVAAGKTKLALAIRLMEQALPELGVGSDEGRDALKALNMLSKHVPPGSVNPGVEQTMLAQLAQKAKQNGMQVQQMRTAQAPMPGQPPAPPQGAMAPPPQAA